jgi:hypothetical protein
MNVVCYGVQSPYRRSRPLPRRGARANGTRPLDGAASLFRPSLGMGARKPLGNDAGAKPSKTACMRVHLDSLHRVTAARFRC